MCCGKAKLSGSDLAGVNVMVPGHKCEFLDQPNRRIKYGR